MGLIEIHNIRLAVAIFGCCINSSFTRGYNSLSVHNIIYVIAEWAHEPIKKQSIEELNNSNSIATISYKNMVEMSYGFGAIIGGLIVFHYSKKFGRKGGLLMINIVCIFGILLSGYCKFFDAPYFLVLGRILLGIKGGLCSALAPMYLFDISPTAFRGKIGALYASFCLIGEITGFLISKFLATETTWPLVFSLNIVPVIIQLLILPVCPESPKYTLVVKKKELECRKAIIWLRGYNLNEVEYSDCVYELLQQKELGGVSLNVFVEHFILMRALLICAVVLISPPLCGVKIIIMYATQSSSALKTESGEQDLVKLALFEIILIVVTFGNIAVIDSIPRQKLLYMTFFTMSVCCAVCCLLVNFFIDINSMVIVLVIFIYLSCFKIGCGCISFFIITEYFNTLSAPLAFSVGLPLAWTMHVCEYLFADRLEMFLKGYLFLNYAIINGALGYFCYKYVIDTRHISLHIVYRLIYDQLMNTKTVFTDSL